MKTLLLAALALACVACADGPSPRQKYGEMYGVTGTHVPKKGTDPAPREVSVYSREALERVQNAGSGGTFGKDPNAPQ